MRGFNPKGLVSEIFFCSDHPLCSTKKSKYFIKNEPTIRLCDSKVTQASKARECAFEVSAVIEAEQGIVKRGVL